MLYGEHIHAQEQEAPPQCSVCSARATVEVFDSAEHSCGYFCLCCGRQKLERLTRLERLFKGTETV